MTDTLNRILVIIWTKLAALLQPEQGDSQLLSLSLDSADWYQSCTIFTIKKVRYLDHNLFVIMKYTYWSECSACASDVKKCGEMLAKKIVSNILSRSHALCGKSWISKYALPGSLNFSAALGCATSS